VLEEELAFANELADAAAEIALSFFHSEFEVHIKPDQTPVTDADLAIEQMVRDRLSERFPKDAVRGEEGGLSGEAPRTWIVDPIDGTKNFAAAIPIWGTLLALEDDGELVLGLASAPALGERYAAAAGRGATCNGREIHVSPAASIEQSMVSYGDVEEWIADPAALPGFLDLVGRARRTRAFGDFWGHVLVARGAVEIMVEPELAIWDYAALAVIVREAGGKATQTDGGPLANDGSLLSTNGVVHDEVVRLLSGTDRSA
jgi:histidinol-phosphatase